ncbi:MAG: hypothetical protein FJZ87_05445 [Chloroflexi bacterium]|nr:hypothetical protein [Chloroflexota bacterium]
MRESKLRWKDPDWQKQAHEWILAEAARGGIRISGAIEQPHTLPWSTVMRVQTTEGVLFFKATAEETIYEIRLTEQLAGWFPDCMPDLVAVDIARGWMLMRDGGEQLRASIRPRKDLRLWEPSITKYAEVQIGLVQHVDEILALGIPDHRLTALPALYSHLLTDKESLLIDKEKGVTSADFQQLQSLEPRFEQLCADLAAFGIPESVDHGDFHDGNVLVKNGRLTFFDWGDASVTHPFVSLRTFFVSMEIALDLDDYAPPTLEMIALRDIYLARWEHFASKEKTLKAYNLSRPVASIVKALLWHNTVSRLTDPLREEYAWIVPEVLREFMVFERMLSA